MSTNTLSRAARRITPFLCLASLAAVTSVSTPSNAYNSAQLAELKKGGAVWNAWRAKHPAEQVDMKSAYLYKVNINDADLHGAWMQGVSLHRGWAKRVNFIGADFTGTSTSKARLEDNDFTEANFTGAKLIWANLRRAKLVKTALSGADFTSANLTGATFTGATYDAATVWPTGFDASAAGAVRVCDLAGKWQKTYDFSVDGSLSGKQSKNEIQLTWSTDKYTGTYVGSQSANKSTFVGTCSIVSSQEKVTIAQTDAAKGYTSTITGVLSAKKITGTWSDSAGNAGDIEIVVAP